MSGNDSGEGVDEGSMAWKARKAPQKRRSPEPSAASSSRRDLGSGTSSSGGPPISQSSPLVARKAAPVSSTVRPKSASPIPIAGNVSIAPKSTSRPTTQVTSKRITVTSKGAQSREYTSKSAASTSKGAVRTTLSGLSGEPSRATSSFLQPSPRNPVLSDFTSAKVPSAKTAKASPLGRPARIFSTSANLAKQKANLKANSAMTIASSGAATSPTPAKSYRSLSPLWQQLDKEHEDRMQLHKRDRDGNVLVKRIASRADRRGLGDQAGVFQLDADDPNRTKAHIGPELRLRSPVLPDESDSDDAPRYMPQKRLPPNRKVPGTQLAFKAARKFRSAESSPESDSETATSSTSPSPSSQDSEEEIDELDSDQSDLELKGPSDRDVEMENLNPDTKSQFVFNTPPPVIVPLPISPERLPEVIHSEPSVELISALEVLTLPCIRMRSTKQLPFLLRNLRKGFYSRCRNLHLPIYHDGRKVKLQVYYEYAGGSTYRAEVSEWQCPLCNLFGSFPTREMLNFHLKSDHPEVYLEWEELDDVDTHTWKLQLVIPEPDSPVAPAVRQTPQRFSSPFPSLTLSPPPPTVNTRDSTPLRDPKKEPTAVLYFKREPQGHQSSATPSLTPDTTSSTRRSHSAAGSAVLTRSTSSATRTPHSPDAQLPIPPRDNPLGPAARPPYLPAQSDYGGPTVYYSSRPGGPCLFDLLGTLPLEKFGLLEWEVLDREDEIYESDDVKEEYKVMHALWARWIILNRNAFIADYYKGVIAFVDEYWKIIHKAAGWDALRYFLFILLANQFLNGHEIAQVLQHYEKHTGMASWCD